MENQFQIPLVFQKVLELADALGVQAINELPGTWVYVLDSEWCIAVNGHEVSIEIPAQHDRFGLTVPPFSIGVWFNGWPAGSVGLDGGVIAAGEGANEANLLKVIEDTIPLVKAHYHTGDNAPIFKPVSAGHVPIPGATAVDNGATRNGDTSAQPDQPTGGMFSAEVMALLNQDEPAQPLEGI